MDLRRVDSALRAWRAVLATFGVPEAWLMTASELGFVFRIRKVPLHVAADDADQWLCELQIALQDACSTYRVYAWLPPCE